MKFEEFAPIVWQLVSMIPEGTVTSYGDLAKQAGYPGHSHQVGTVLRNLPPSSQLPWHRVIKSDGRLGFKEGSEQWRRQKRRLEAEGISLIRERIPKRYFHSSIQYWISGF